MTEAKIKLTITFDNGKTFNGKMNLSQYYDLKRNHNEDMFEQFLNLALEEYENQTI